MSKKKTEKKAPVSIEQRVFELMHPQDSRGQGGISLDEALKQAIAEGCKYKGR